MTRKLACGVLLTALLTYSSIAAAAPATGPAPIRIERVTPGPPVIPEVPRDQVICFALYTVQNGVLKMSAQLYPLRKGEARTVALEVHGRHRRDAGATQSHRRDAGATREAGAAPGHRLKTGATGQAGGTSQEWQRVAEAAVDEKGLAVFRVEGWDHSRDVRYRVVHAGGSQFEGLIRRDPHDKDEIVVAAFTGNSNTDRGPRPDIVANVRHQDPDLLFFSGDQSYDHKQHTAAWLIFGTQFRDIIRDRPTITIPDDHDVGQGNLWGQGGKVSMLQGASDGGYVMPAEYVKMVERAQTSHLPDPYDPTPIGQGIGVYYTSLNVGGIDFAILEDRKFKTGPAGLIRHDGPRPDHMTDPAYDRASIDVPEAELLGERQLKFLRAWGQDWSGVTMKAVLSQTIFAGGAHVHGQHNNRVVADLDSNGWPQSGRAAALREMRRCFAFHIAGDQHLATVIHHGINDWEDAGWSFCVPSIVNYYGRWWWPLEEPVSRLDGNPLPFTGRYFDGFGNKLTMHAYANPTAENHNAAGYGLVRFHKPSRKITVECWARHVDVAAGPTSSRNADAADAPLPEPGIAVAAAPRGGRPGATGQHPGWPVTIDQFANYARKPVAYLPTLKIAGASDPVIQVIDEESQEPVYTVRIKGNTFRPGVFKEGAYTIRVGEGAEVQTLRGVQSLKVDQQKDLLVKVEAAPRS